MLLKLSFRFRARYLPPRARVPRSGDFLSEDYLEIADVSPSETVRAYVLTPGPGVRPVRSAPRDIVAWRGRLYWSAVDGSGLRRLDAGAWIADLAVPPTASPLPDLLGRAPAKYQGPSQRLEDVPIRRLIEDDRETALTGLRRAAADLLLVGGRIYRRGGEPAWLVAAPIRHFHGVARHAVLDAVDPDAPNAVPAARFDPPIPFIGHELYRADLGREARALLSRRVRRPSLDAILVRGPDRWRIRLRDAAPSADLLTPQLRRLCAAVGETARWGLSAVRAAHRIPAQASDAEVAGHAHAPRWLHRLHGVGPAPDRGSARTLVGWISEVLLGLEDADLREDVFGRMETVAAALRRALERADVEIAAGRVPKSAEDAVADLALGGVFGA